MSGDEPRGDNGKSEIGPLMGDSASGSAVALILGFDSSSSLSVSSAC